MAREFDRELKLLVLDQPTRGLDVGSIEFIHRQVIAKRDAGTAVLLVSAELDEVLEMSDRIGVMYARPDRRACVDGRTADKNEVGLLMATGGGDRERQPARGGPAMSAPLAPAPTPVRRFRWPAVARLVGRGRPRRRDRPVGSSLGAVIIVFSELLVPGRSLRPGPSARRLRRPR